MDLVEEGFQSSASRSTVASRISRCNCWQPIAIESNLRDGRSPIAWRLFHEYLGIHWLFRLGRAPSRIVSQVWLTEHISYYP